MKAHIGVDEDSGIVHTVLASTAKDVDITCLPALIHGQEDGEHPFRIVKCLFGYRKVRYKGIFKNFMHQTTLFFLSNLYLLRHLVQKSKIQWA